MRIAVHAGSDNVVRQNGAAMFIPAGSLDRDTTASITRVTEQPPGAAPVLGFDFDIGHAKLLSPVTLTLPVTDAPAVGPDGMTLVSYLSKGVWGTDLGHYDARSRTVTLTVTHLSWYGDLADVLYQGIRKVLAEWLGHFRGSRPSCGTGPDISYPLATMFEAPILACAEGDQNGGVLKIVNNRGFYLMVEPTRGLTLNTVKVDGILDSATSHGGAVVRYLAQWNSLPLPPGGTAEFTYKPVTGGPALSFEPDGPATFISAVLSLFSGISDPGSILLYALGCARGLHNTGPSAIGGCVADALTIGADKGWDGLGGSVKVAGITISRSLLGLLSVVLRAIPELDIIVESRDDGSTSTIQINVVPSPIQVPTTTPNPTQAPGTTPTLTVTLTENPFRCDGGSRTLGYVAGARPGERVTFTSPELGPLNTGTASSTGRVPLTWICQPVDAGSVWHVTARSASGGSVTFAVVGAIAPVPPTTPPPTVYYHHVYHTCSNGKCGLNTRSGPGYTSYSVTRVLVDGDQVGIVCQAKGEPVSGIDGSSSDVWDKLVEGDWAADFYIDTPGMTGSFSPPIPQC